MHEHQLLQPLSHLKSSKNDKFIKLLLKANGAIT